VNLIEKITNRKKVAELELALEDLKIEKAKLEGTVSTLWEMLETEQAKLVELQKTQQTQSLEYEKQIEELTDKLATLTAILDKIEAATENKVKKADSK
jgi:aminopeptidase N